jgi:hypothetical protein
MTLRPQLGSSMPPQQGRWFNEDGTPTLDAWRFFERLSAMNADDEPFILTMASESATARIEELSARLEQLEATAAQDASTAQATLEAQAAELESLRAAVDETAFPRTASGELAELDEVDTPQIVSRSVTYPQVESATADETGSASTNKSMVTLTTDEELLSGSTAIVRVTFSVLALFDGNADITLNNSGIGAARYVYLELVRDPSGTPVVLESQDIATPIAASTSLTLTNAGQIGFSHEDTGHGGGTVTYGVRIVSYDDGTKTTAASSNIAWSNVRREISLLEVKR